MTEPPRREENTGRCNRSQGRKSWGAIDRAHAKQAARADHAFESAAQSRETELQPSPLNGQIFVSTRIVAIRSRPVSSTRHLFGLVEPHELPRFARVIGAIHTIAMRDTPLRIVLARENQLRARIPWVHHDGAHGVRRLPFKDRHPRRAADDGLPPPTRRPRTWFPACRDAPRHWRCGRRRRRGR